MSVTLMMVSHFAQKVRCEPSPPHIRAKRQIFVFNIGSPVGFVPAGLFSWAGEENGESWGSAGADDMGWRGAGGLSSCMVCWTGVEG